MKTNVLSILSLLVMAVCLLLLYQTSYGQHVQTLKHLKEGDPQQKNEYDRLRYSSPFSGEIPANIRARELQFAREEASFKRRQAKTNFDFENASWKSRGPINVGGRTRAIAIDVTDENVILAAGVSGGVWKSRDAGSTWERTFSAGDLRSVTAIQQDTRPGMEHIWYYTTGEGTVGNSASSFRAPFAGDGVYKSEDGGDSWQVLPSTQTNTPHAIDGYFDFASDIDIHNETGAIYVAGNGAILKSADGGATWRSVLADSDVSSGGRISGGVCAIHITKNGTLYAVIEGWTTFGGIYRSTDGENWTLISDAHFTSMPFHLPFGRFVIDSEEKGDTAVYFLGVMWDSNFTSVSPHLYSYRYFNGVGNGDGSFGNGGLWGDLSANLPGFGGNTGDFNPQFGYNLALAVHPSESNTLFIGGASAWRSTTAFSSDSHTDLIGGYAAFNEDFEFYENHHPDIHEYVFYPDDPYKMICATDGGLFVTENNMEFDSDNTVVHWQSLNGGYLTTQAHTLAIDETVGSDALIAGFQDNGTWLATDSASSTIWSHEIGGDGSYCELIDRPDSKTVYGSLQSGMMFRLDYDADFNFIDYTRLDPVGFSDPRAVLIINPMQLDPNNESLLYTQKLNQIWRNPNTLAAPISDVAIDNTYWEVIEDTTHPFFFIANFDVSTIAPANRIVFGTNGGDIYKIDGANMGNPAMEYVGSYLDAIGDSVNPWVGCVKIDPTNGDRFFVGFTNYEVHSIIMTEDAGQTWTNVSGNLEENPDGTGAGPSVRWIELLHLNGKEVVFVGTSTGVYATEQLDGMNTIWTLQSPDLVGNVPVTMIKTREDGSVVVGTHGNGLFSAVFMPSIVTGNEAYVSLDQVLFPNPTSDILYLKNETGNRATYTVYNLSGRVLTTKISDEQIDEINMSGFEPGIYVVEKEIAGQRIMARVMKH